MTRKKAKGRSRVSDNFDILAETVETTPKMLPLGTVQKFGAVVISKSAWLRRCH
jgi:hypothetical protein